MRKKRLPSGDSPGKYRRAKLSLTMTAVGDSGCASRHSQISSRDERDSHRPQEARRHRQIPRRVGVDRPTGDPHALVAPGALEQPPARQARRLDAGCLFEALQQRGPRGQAPAPGPVLATSAVTLTSARLLASNPRSVRTSFAKLVRHSPATNSTTKLNADLRRHERPEQSRRASRAFRRPISARLLAGRRRREGPGPARTGTSRGCPRRRNTRTRQSSCRSRRTIDARRRKHRHDRRRRDDGKQRAERARGERQQPALDQHLLNQAAAPGANRRPQRHLALRATSRAPPAGSRRSRRR